MVGAKVFPEPISESSDSPGGWKQGCSASCCLAGQLQGVRVGRRPARLAWVSGLRKRKFTQRGRASICPPPPSPPQVGLMNEHFGIWRRWSKCGVLDGSAFILHDLIGPYFFWFVCFAVVLISMYSFFTQSLTM